MKADKVSYIEGLYNKSYGVKTLLDRDTDWFEAFNKKGATKQYEMYLQEKVKNPVAAAIAMRDTVQKHPINNWEDFTKNRVALERQPQIDKLVKQIEQIEAQYPKTGYIRQELIAQGRVNLNYITPRLTGLKKLALKLKMFV